MRYPSFCQEKGDKRTVRSLQSASKPISIQSAVHCKRSILLSQDFFPQKSGKVPFVPVNGHAKVITSFSKGVNDENKIPDHIY
jgi:hypothetical protein